MKSILFVIPSLGIGGAEKSLIELLKNIDACKYRVKVMLLTKEGSLVSEIAPWVSIIKPRGVISRFYQSLPISLKLLFRTKEYKLLFLRILISFFNRLLSKRFRPHIQWLCIKDKVPSDEAAYDVAIAYLQGPAEYYVVDKVTAQKKVFWMHTSFSAYSDCNKVEQSYIAAFDRIVCVSEASRRDFVQIFSNKAKSTDVIYNIIDLDAARIKAQETSPLPDDGKLKIVSVGRLVHAKGYDVSIEAFARFNALYPNSAFYIVGDGTLRHALTRKIKRYRLEHDCFLVGSTPNPYPYMRQADVILQASRHEGYCIVLSEAKALGKPIISTDFFGAREQLCSEKSSIIIEELSADAIVQALKKLLIDTPPLHSQELQIGKVPPVAEHIFDELMERLYNLPIHESSNSNGDNSTLIHS